MENSKGGKEKRRVHIIYFLSRMGQVEQPHLLCVRHLSDGGGVYLRDVKRWLAHLRGKDMPQAFSWSYKRKYKTGYVWQDLVDDDLITPISDNEYVLQGSQLTLPIPSLFDSCSSQKKTLIFKEEKLEKQKLDVKMENVPEKFSSDQMNNGESSSICSSERSTISDEYDNLMKLEEESKDLEIEKEGEEVERFKNQYSSLYSKLVNNKKKMKDMDKDKEGGSSNSFSSSSTTTSSSSSTNSQSDSFTKSKRYSNGASTKLRHWITCGTLDTNDKALIKNRFAKDHSLNQPFDNPKNEAEICKGDKFGGSARVFGSCFDQQLEIHKQQSSRKSFDGGMDSRKKRQKDCSNGKMASAAAYKPMGFPNCSQCGKTFKPEKMYAHMKSCRGLKSLASNSDKYSSKSTTTTSNKESVSGYLLAN